MRQDRAGLQSITGQPVPLRRVSARGVVNGLLFELEVTQRYCNESPTNIEAVYTFPLPHGAVLLDLTVRLGEKTLVGVIVEKRAAATRYEEAIETGDTAVLLEQAANGLCTMNLGNLMAGESASIRYRYAQLLRFEQGSVRLVVPTVIAPRYGDPQAAGLERHQVPQHDLVVAYPLELSARLNGLIAQGRIASPSHAIATKREGDDVEIALANTGALDRDFVLTISGLAQHSLAVVARDGDGYVALASFCAEVPSTASELPITVKLLVDCSGSMGGDSIAAAKRALHRILASLHPTDRFTLSRFGGSVSHDVATPSAADSAAVRRAADCVDRIDANLGGTEMAAALRAVFALGPPVDSADVLLITDGEIWNAETLIIEAQRARHRVFVVGIGAAPAEGVLRRIAEATDGACDFVAPGEEAEAGIVRMFGRLRAPRIERAAVAWPAQTAWSTAPAGGLFGGETLHAWAGFDALPRGQAGLLLAPGDESPPIEAFVTLPAPIDHPALTRVAAASRLAMFEPDAQLTLALRYSLLTARTSFVVVHERAAGERADGMPALRTVPQMLAAGWGGYGTVRAVMPPPPHAACRMPPLAAPKVRVEPRAIDEATASRLWPAIHELDRIVSAYGRDRLPRTLDELAAYRVPSDVIDALRGLVSIGYAEGEIVRAFLEALRPLAIRFNASRELVRALRKDFTWNGRRRALQQRMTVIAADMLKDEFRTPTNVA